jgi:hypothetical protein
VPETLFQCRMVCAAVFGPKPLKTHPNRAAN